MRRIKDEERLAEVVEGRRSKGVGESRAAKAINTGGGQRKESPAGLPVL